MESYCQSLARAVIAPRHTAVPVARQSLVLRFCIMLLDLDCKQSIIHRYTPSCRIVWMDKDRNVSKRGHNLSLLGLLSKVMLLVGLSNNCNAKLVFHFKVCRMEVQYFMYQISLSLKKKKNCVLDVLNFLLWICI